MVASILGVVISGASLLALLSHGYWAANLVRQQWQADDQYAVAQMLRAELRIAGHRHLAGPSAGHDHLKVDTSGSTVLQYRCDACGADAQALPASFRLQAGALTHRSFGSSAHQALHDPTLLAWSNWQIDQGLAEHCVPWIHVTLQTATLGGGLAASTVKLQARPRNLGLRACE